MLPQLDERSLPIDFRTLLARAARSDHAFSRRGDLWRLEPHRLMCGDARSDNDIDRLMDGGRTGMAITDPPFNVKAADIVGRGRIKHPEFAMASGEMRKEEFTTFLAESLSEPWRRCCAMAGWPMRSWIGATWPS